MLLALALFVAAILLAVTSAWMLPRAKWQVRFPALALWCWTVSFLGGFTLVISAFALTIVEAIRASESASIESGVAFFAAWIGLGGVGAIVAYASTSYERVGIAQSRVAERATAIAISREEFADYTLVRFESPEATAFAIPHRQGAEIFVSDALEKTLTTAQLQAVLSHELAHIRYRHHLLLRLGILADACTPKFLTAGKKIRSSFTLLIELVADDAAAKEAGAANLANALSRVSAFGADGASMALRAERLSQRRWPIHEQVHKRHSKSHETVANHVRSI
ncbi:MAG: M48 family metalloprotease [Microbacteriaceae bacterium]|nr:M48 family metalloprotease [Microbacteriaceae bacterium]